TRRGSCSWRVADEGEGGVGADGDFGGDMSGGVHEEAARRTRSTEKLACRELAVQKHERMEVLVARARGIVGRHAHKPRPVTVDGSLPLDQFLRPSEGAGQDDRPDAREARVPCERRPVRDKWKDSVVLCWPIGVIGLPVIAI